MTDPSKPLINTRHEVFAVARASGKTGAESYRGAGYSLDKTGANAGKLTKNYQISARVDWLKAQTASAAVLTQIRKREILAVIAEDTKAKDSDRIAAIRADNDLSPDSADNKLVITINRLW